MGSTTKLYFRPDFIYLFAVVVFVIYNNDSINSLVEDMNRKVVNVYAWFQTNKISVNIDKTNCMLFSPKCACRPDKILLLVAKVHVCR